MKRFFAFGCSYTAYTAFTYADFLGHQFEEYHNLGDAGSGNHYIFHTFIKALHHFDFNPNDTVVVQWSSLLREDRYPGNIEQPMEYPSAGQVDNNPYFNDDFLTDFFNPIEQLHLLDFYIEHILYLQQKLQFKVKFTYMLEPWFGPTFGEPNMPIHGITAEKWYSKYKDDSKLEKLKTLSENSEIFLSRSIEDFCFDNIKEKQNIHLNYGPDNEIIAEEDSHPSVLQHFKYAKFVSKELGIDLVKYNISSIEKIRDFLTLEDRDFDRHDVVELTDRYIEENGIRC